MINDTDRTLAPKQFSRIIGVIISQFVRAWVRPFLGPTQQLPTPLSTLPFPATPQVNMGLCGLITIGTYLYKYKLV